MPTSVVEDLKRRIGAWGTDRPLADRPGVSTGCASLDARLPSHQFSRGAVHEFQGAAYPDRVACLGVVLALCVRLLAQMPGPLLWVQLREAERLHVHAPGFAAFGLDPGRIIKITPKSEKDLLWVVEEALGCSSVGAVAGILWAEKLYDFTASRRLALRAQASGVPALMVRSHRAQGLSAAASRWRVASLPSASQRLARTLRIPVGLPHWTIELLRCRGAAPGTLSVGWNYETLCFDLASRTADRAAVAPERKGGNAIGDRRAAL